MRRNMTREETVGTSSSLHVEGSALANEEPETSEERYRRMGKAKVTETTPASYPVGGTRRLHVTTPPTTRYVGPQHRHGKSRLGQPSTTRTKEARHKAAKTNTPWRLWTAAKGAASEVHISQATMTATIDETRRRKIDGEIRKRDHTDFGRKAWIQADMMSNTWVTTCPKEHSALNAGQFPVVYEGMEINEG